MISSARIWARRVLRRTPLLRRCVRSDPIPHGLEGIREVGHRRYVGGMWDAIGKLQFDYLVAEGLRPEHYLLDVACGSLRGGVFFIPYLEPGHYLGIDKEEVLVRADLEEELDPAVREARKPEIVVSDSFEFERLPERPHYAIAQSLFTHLPPSIIHLCFERLRGFMREDGVFYATFFVTDEPAPEPEQPHDHGHLAYTREQIVEFGSTNGWTAEYVGDWNHPRDQMMARYRTGS